MPSPLAHMAAGYSVYQIYNLTYRPTWKTSGTAHATVPVTLFIGASLLPDVDAVLGLLLGNFGRLHNQGTHSLFVGLVAALAVAGIVHVARRQGAIHWAALTFICYALHLFMDSLTTGRGVMLLWPFSAERFLSPVSLFQGVHWSQGWANAITVGTVMSELPVVLLAIGLTIIRHRLHGIPEAEETLCA
jgi:inner membrane protein